MSPGPEPRIGDAERETAVRALGEHYAAGRITKEEFDERSDAAMRARTNSDLRPLFADLPVPAGPPPGEPERPNAVPRRRVNPLVWVLVPLVVPLVTVLVLAAVITKVWWLIPLAALVFLWRPRHRRCSTPRRRPGHFSR